jgi:hypothetical protein
MKLCALACVATFALAAAHEPAAQPYHNAGSPWVMSQAGTGGSGTAPDLEGSAKPRLSGFVSSTLAYTYSNPAHWSRAVTRFQLNAEGGLGPRVKWKLGGRVDVDPIYYGSDFYLPDVKKDQRLDFFWRENYIDFEAAGWDFRVGAQNIVWGEVVGLFFADVVSALDTRDFVLPSFDIIRIPQWAARAEYFKGDSHIEFIWIPVPTYNVIGKPGADFYPAPLPSPTPEGQAALFKDPQRPARGWGEGNYGVRANTLVKGWDVAAFYYRSYSRDPTFYRVPSSAIGQPYVFQPLHDRIWQVGGTVSKDFGEVVLRGEAVYTSGQRYASSDPLAPSGVVRATTVNYIVSAEVPLPRDARLNVQAFQRFYPGGRDSVALDFGNFGASVLLSGKLGAAVEPELLWVQTFGGGGGMIRPRVSWLPWRNLRLSTGVDVFTGPQDGLFGRYNNRDRVYAELRYDF